MTDPAREAAERILAQPNGYMENRNLEPLARAYLALPTAGDGEALDHRDPNQDDIAMMRQALSIYGKASNGPSAEDIGFAWQSHVRRLLHAILEARAALGESGA